MELEILQENLAEKLALATRFISSKPQLPILSHLFLEATDRQFRLLASDLETSIIVPVSAKVLSSGKFTVPARTLFEVVAALSAEKLTLKVDESALKIAGGKYSGKIIGASAVDYPPVIPNDEPTQELEIDSSKLALLVGKTSFATAQDETRVALTGVLFKLSGDGLTLAATDGFRLSVANLKVTPSKSDQPFPSLIIPSRTLIEVSRLISEKGKGEGREKTKLRVLPSNQIAFTVGDIEIYSRLISANFPDYEKIIPSSSEINLTLSTDELYRAVKLSSVFAREAANIVRFYIDADKLNVRAQGGQVGENDVEIGIDLEKPPKEPFSIAFNYRYLLDFLSSVEGSKELSLELTGPVSPAVFRLPTDSSFLHIIMPVRVQS